MSQLEEAYRIARTELLRQRNEHGWWTGELSVSPLATAVAVVALRLCDRNRHRELIEGGLEFLRRTQNPDGGWGDTLKSFSNISTTMLANAAFHATKDLHGFPVDATVGADKYIASKGGVPGLIKRYGKDKTFSVPILTCCALAGIVDWKLIPRLPFELAWLPPRFYKTVKLPVVSYALPALIAIGQVRHHHGFHWWNPLHLIRGLARKPTLERLETLQPENGGFLEATPLTAFVTMSLAGTGLPDHPVAKKGVEFLVASVRPDGGWPIDTNLATWVTTLSINALGDDLDCVDKDAIRNWLLSQQNKTIHPYTQAEPGGWAWTELPGGVPDADDTAGALLALAKLCKEPDAQARAETPAKVALAGAAGSDQKVLDAAENGVRWLLSLQNRDGGFPTFCRGWGALPFDRSSPDITAHALRAIAYWRSEIVHWKTEPRWLKRIDEAVEKGVHYLLREQRSNGWWIPLWFGDQHHPEEENPSYGTSRVIMALADERVTSRIPSWMAEDAAEATVRGRDALIKLQYRAWAGADRISTEEEALAVESLASSETSREEIKVGVNDLVRRVKFGLFTETAPIGFYFAKLWYFERLYPIIWTVGALRRAREHRGTTE